jgi:SAM-dependent methyltransferase
VGRLPSASEIPLPPPHLDFVGAGDFRAIGEEFLRYFVQLGGLQPHHRVLDVGCGVGRMAAPLARYLEPSATYEGFDVVPEGIEWCLQEISTRHPNFRFRLADVRNAWYHPTGGQQAAQYVFPYAERSFDFAFLTSVFTHMVPAELERYVAEVARVLAVNGRALMTFFLLTPDSLAMLAAGRSTLDFRHQVGEYRVLDPALPEEAVAQPEARIREILASHGLVIVEPVHYGGWCGRRPTMSYQDIVVVQR